MVLVGPTDAGRRRSTRPIFLPCRSIFGGTVTCDLPINSGPQHYVLSAALRQLERWVRSGRGPAPAPPLSVQPGSPPIVERDPLGNAVGGIRTPQVDVPIATISGIGQPAGSPCRRFGTTIAFDAATIASLYPDHRLVRRRRRRARRSARSRRGRARWPSTPGRSDGRPQRPASDASLGGRGLGYRRRERIPEGGRRTAACRAPIASGCERSPTRERSQGRNGVPSRGCARRRPRRRAS